METMTEPVTGSASLHEFAMASLKAAHEALARLVESARQAQNLASQSADPDARSMATSGRDTWIVGEFLERN